MLIVLVWAVYFINPLDVNSVFDSSINPDNVNITFTGDVMMGRGVDKHIKENRNVFAGIINLTKSSDLTVINLESPLTDSNDGINKEILLKTNPSYTNIIKEAGIDLATLANNHIVDYGTTGLFDTMNNLKNNGIDYVGAGANIVDSNKPVYYTIKDKKIAVISASEFDGPNCPAATQNTAGFTPLTSNYLKQAIDEAKIQNADYIICNFHFGQEYVNTASEFQKKMAYEAIDQGAYAVIGNHPHVTQSIENYKGKLICYSLGNTVFDQVLPGTKESIIVVLNINNNTPSLEIYPMKIVGTYPQLMNTEESKNYLDKVQSYSTNVTIENKDTGIGIINF